MEITKTTRETVVMGKDRLDRIDQIKKELNDLGNSDVLTINLDEGEINRRMGSDVKRAVRESGKNCRIEKVDTGYHIYPVKTRTTKRSKKS